MAFLAPLPVCGASQARQCVTSRPRISAKAKKSTRAKPNPPPKPPLPDPGTLKQRLFESLSGLDRGLSIDADAEVLTPEEAVVEDLIALLEDGFTPGEATASPRLPGTWELVYTSSSITRFFGGVTGMKRLLPGGNTGSIRQVIDMEDGTSQYVEKVRFEVPVVGSVEWEAVAEGNIRRTSEVRMLWEPENVKVGWFSWFADGWKTLRAFQISDITYLDDTLRITRGTTGSVHVYQRV